MFTSTSPRELFRPMMIRFCLTIYSNSLPSNLAITVPLLSGLHCTLEGLAGADLRAKRAQASLSWDCECEDITSRTREGIWNPIKTAAERMIVYPQSKRGWQNDHVTGSAPYSVVK